jgi:hypothetical protein
MACNSECHGAVTTCGYGTRCQNAWPIPHAIEPYNQAAQLHMDGGRLRRVRGIKVPLPNQATEHSPPVPIWPDTCFQNLRPGHNTTGIQDYPDIAGHTPALRFSRFDRYGFSKPFKRRYVPSANSSSSEFRLSASTAVMSDVKESHVTTTSENGVRDHVCYPGYL